MTYPLLKMDARMTRSLQFERQYSRKRFDPWVWYQQDFWFPLSHTIGVATVALQTAHISHIFVEYVP